MQKQRYLFREMGTMQEIWLIFKWNNIIHIHHITIQKIFIIHKHLKIHLYNSTWLKLNNWINLMKLKQKRKAMKGAQRNINSNVLYELMTTCNYTGKHECTNNSFTINFRTINMKPSSKITNPKYIITTKLILLKEFRGRYEQIYN